MDIANEIERFEEEKEEKKKSKELALRDPVGYVLNTVKSVSVFKPEDIGFLVEHKDHLWKVMEKSYIWRTPMQKMSIVSDNYCPTLHSKFHQTLAEQKVQFDQAMYLAKEYEEKKLGIEELELVLDEINDQIFETVDQRKI